MCAKMVSRFSRPTRVCFYLKKDFVSLETAHLEFRRKQGEPGQQDRVCHAVDQHARREAGCCHGEGVGVELCAFFFHRETPTKTRFGNRAATTASKQATEGREGAMTEDDESESGYGSAAEAGLGDSIGSLRGSRVFSSEEEAYKLAALNRQAMAEMDTDKMDTGWTRRYMAALSHPDAKAQQKLQRAAGLRELYVDFVGRASAIATTLVREMHLPPKQKTHRPVNAGGIAGGEKYIVDGLYFKFARDWCCASFFSFFPSPFHRSCCSQSTSQSVSQSVSQPASQTFCITGRRERERV